MDFGAFPGSELVLPGLDDLAAGRETVNALLVLVGAPRLRRLGFEVPERPADGDLPEHRLYHLLGAIHGDNAHSKYNALIRRLVSFERAVACAK